MPAQNARVVRLSGANPLALTPKEIAADEEKAAPGEDPAITKVAQQWWAEFSSGRIDRSQVTGRVDKALTDAVLAQTKARWAPQSWTFKGKRESGGVTVHLYRVTFPKGQVWNVTMALTADGKLAGYRGIPY